MESEKARAKRLINNYGITIPEWEAVDSFQNHVCFACGHPNRKKQRLATDHDHEDGLYRGHLCSSCNALLGKIENAFKRYGLHKLPGVTVIKILSRLSEYLSGPPAVRALGRHIFGYPGRVGTKAHRTHLKRLAKQKAKASS